MEFHLTKNWNILGKFSLLAIMLEMVIFGSTYTGGISNKKTYNTIVW